MREVYYHAGIGFKYNFVRHILPHISAPCGAEEYTGSQFQPITLDRSPVDNSPLSPPAQPYLQPSYYAGLVINTAVGREAGSGTTEIVELEISAPNLSGYAVYETGKLVRAVFVNLNAWLQSDEEVRERSVYHIDLGFASADDGEMLDPAGKEVKIKRLNIGYADDTSNLTWGGQSWETPKFLVSGEEVFETKSWEEGVDIKETEAVLVWF